MSCLPIAVVSYDYPLSPEGSKHFLSQAERWLRESLSWAGAIEHRVYRSADGTSPLVTVATVYDTLENALAIMPAASKLAMEMRAYGATNIEMRVLAPSPVYPDPIKA